MREAQSVVSRQVPHCGLAVTIDIGEADDIHPKNKQDVGKRLALWAAATVYGVQGIRPHGPRYVRHAVEGSSLRVTFDDKTLQTRADAAVHGFAIAGADRKWHFAHAAIAGDQVIVSSPQVERPVAIRYAWANNPIATVIDANGLPMEPFRTDSW